MPRQTTYTPVYTAHQERVFTDYLNKYKGIIYAVINQNKRIQRHEREDYFQEAAIYVWRRFHLFDRQLGSFSHWLWKTTEWGIKHYRRYLRKDQDVTYYDGKIESWYDIADLIYDESHIESLKMAINELPADERMCVDQFLTGGTRTEILNEIGLSEKQYELRMSNARKTIRNNRHKYFDGITVDPRKFESIPTGRTNELHPDSKPVIMLNMEGKFIKRFPSAAETERQGFSRTVVMNVCNGKGWTHKGYRWIYEGETRPEILALLNKPARKRGEGQKCRAVNQYDIWGTYIRKFKSMGEAERSGFNLSNIKNFKDGEMRRCQGFLWSIAVSD